MKKTNRIKLALDILMLVILLLMYRSDVLGLGFHEIGGMAVCGLFIIHILLNGKWTMVVAGKLFSSKTAWRNKLNWLIDFLLLLCFAYILISGIFISKIVFDGQRGVSAWKTGHFAVSALALVLLGIHLGLHYESIITRTPARGLPLPFRRMAAVAMSALILGFGVYQMTATSFLDWMGDLGAVVRTNETPPADGHGEEQQLPGLADGAVGGALVPEGELEETHGGGRGGGKGSGKGKNANNGGFYPSALPEVLLGFLSITLIPAVIVAWTDGVRRARKRNKLVKCKLKT
jgi:hypothetical protein